FNSLREESLKLITEILLRTEELTTTLVVNEDRMLHNDLRNKGLYNSEYVMMKLAKKLSKDKSHSLMYEITMKTTNEGEDFFKNQKQNNQIDTKFTDAEIKEMIDPRNYTGQASTLAETAATEAQEKAVEIFRNYQ